MRPRSSIFFLILIVGFFSFSGAFARKLSKVKFKSLPLYKNHPAGLKPIEVLGQDTDHLNRSKALDTVNVSDSGRSTKRALSQGAHHGRIFPLPPGLRNPGLMDGKSLHPFSEYQIKKQIQNPEAALWFSKEGVRDYLSPSKIWNKDPLAHRNHGSERKIRATWILLFILLVILIQTFIKFQFPNDLMTLQESLFNDRLIRDDRELRFLRSPSSILTLFAFCLATGLLVYFYFRDQGIDLPYQGFQLFAILSLGLLIFFFLKILLLWLIGLIFNLVRPIQSYLSLNYIVMANFTLLISPFLLIYALNKTLIVHYLLVWIPFLIVIFFVFLYIRSIIFFVSNYRFSNFYLFLYFCAVEICPLLLVFKVIYA